MSKHSREMKIFNHQYLVKKKISSGSFGVVFLGLDKLTGQEVAMKIEKEDNEETRSLDREAHILNSLQGITGVPKIYWSGQEGAYNVLVQQLLGYDLAHYIKFFKKFSLKTVLLIADSLLQTLEEVHNRSIIHRDLKPENILVGRGAQSSLLFLVDYGISKQFKDNQGNHIPPKEGKPFIGTTRYASVGAHKGQELGRGDDLESLAYVLVFMFKGSLPWQNLQNVNDRDKTKVVGQMKANMSSSVLCKDMPIEFEKYLDYVKSLQFKSQPDYKYLCSLVKKAAFTHNITNDSHYDWKDFQKKYELPNGSGKTIPETQKYPINQKEEKKKKEPLSFTNTNEINKKELSSLADGHSQFDFLRPPDPYAKGRALIQRTQERRKSNASSQYSLNKSFQGSVVNNYIGSKMIFDDDEEQINLKNNLKLIQNKDIEQSMIEFNQLESGGVIEKFEFFDQFGDDGTVFSGTKPEEHLEYKYNNLLQQGMKFSFKDDIRKKTNKSYIQPLVSKHND